MTGVTTSINTDGANSSPWSTLSRTVEETPFVRRYKLQLIVEETPFVRRYKLQLIVEETPFVRRYKLQLIAQSIYYLRRIIDYMSLILSTYTDGQTSVSGLFLLFVDTWTAHTCP